MATCATPPKSTSSSLNCTFCQADTSANHKRVQLNGKKAISDNFQKKVVDIGISEVPVEGLSCQSCYRKVVEFASFKASCENVMGGAGTKKRGPSDTPLSSQLGE